jgi:flagellar motility protein MotE (MotC chaperone)
MDKKIIIIGSITMLLVIISTLALVGVLVDPGIFGIKKQLPPVESVKIKSNPRLDSLRRDSTKRENLQHNLYIYDQLNYSLSTLSLQREKLLLSDSIYKIWKMVDYYKKRNDSVLNTINSGLKTTDSLKKTIVNLNTKEGKGKEGTKNKVEYSNDQVMGYAKVYEGMDPARAAKQLELMSEEDALELLINMQARPAAKILDKIEPIKAAKIWLILNSKKKR